MDKRPELSRELDGAVFRSFYYLKEELTAFCRANGLPASGGKLELTERIARYLDTGEILPVQRVKRSRPANDIITLETPIERDIVCSERHRAFFREQIGGSFAFHAAFQNWLKEHPGETYAQAVEAYHRIQAERKKGGGAIARQFAYNTYIRDFFADNPGKTLTDAIACWKYKRTRPGGTRYEPGDLTALEGASPV